MKRKYLYALSLLLFLSTVAFSNERARYRCKESETLPCATAEAAANSSGEHVLLHTFIQLLYI